MSSLRVLACVFTCCPPGKPGFTGGESLLGWNLLVQIARVHEVWALTQTDDRLSVEQGLTENSISNIHFKYVSLPSWLRPLLRFPGGHQFYYHLWQLKAYFVAKKLHEEQRFDLFHHITYANDWLASFIGALLPVPYIRGPGGGAQRSPKGFESEYPFSGRLWEKIRALGQWIFRRDPFFIRGRNRASAILVCNQESMSNVPAAWSHKTHFFPVSGISSQDLARTAPVNPTVHQFRVLSAGSLITVKGFGLAIKAFKKFVENYPDAGLRIIGSGPEEPRLRALIHRLQLDNKVQLLRAMPRDELMSEMVSCDVFLFPSLRDGGGTVVIEAMSAGKPVVCLDTGGPGMHITEECGIKIAPSSRQATILGLASALESLFLDNKLRLKLGQAGRLRAERLYHWDRLGERLMEIYDHAVHAPSSY